jgi:hypothetical protein
MAQFDLVAIAPISLKAIASTIFLAAMVVATLVLVSSTALFFFYLVVSVQRIMRHKR